MGTQRKAQQATNHVYDVSSKERSHADVRAPQMIGQEGPWNAKVNQQTHQKTCSYRRFIYALHTLLLIIMDSSRKSIIEPLLLLFSSLTGDCSNLLPFAKLMVQHPPVDHDDPRCVFLRTADVLCLSNQCSLALFDSTIRLSHVDQTSSNATADLVIPCASSVCFHMIQCDVCPWVELHRYFLVERANI